jgi:putative nucleotidyltransferase with HDIG domain
LFASHFAKAVTIRSVYMDRARAVDELAIRLKNTNLIKHSLAVEAIMRDLAFHLKEMPDMWGIAGLLHDIDYERTTNNPKLHGIIGAEILENLGIDSEITYAVKAHNAMTGIERNRKIDKALYCADPVSGFITAAALILPAKKLDDVSVEFLLKKMTVKSFAKGAGRGQIMSCKDIGLSLEEFLKISLDAMKKISIVLDL